MPENIYDECARLSRKTKRIYLPNSNCEVRGIPRIESGILIIEYCQAPGIVNDRPTATDRLLVATDVRGIEYRLQGRHRGDHITLVHQAPLDGEDFK